jgi:dTDP-4-dehydrorhamnose reductase
MTTRWLVTGAAGQVGSNVVELLAGQDVVGLARADLDITSPAAVDEVVATVRPEIVINAAAYTAVDVAETAESDAFAVNATGPALLAAALARHGGRLVHVSTDYVFDGRADRPYEPDDPTAPATAYGRTKLAGEQAAMAALPGCQVVRSAWLYGGPGPNFVDTMLSLERSRETVDVVADQIGSPTWARDLAAGLVQLGSAPARPGVVHYAASGQASWCDLAREIFRGVGAEPDRVRAVTSDRFPRPAPRPLWSVLSTRSWIERGLPAPRDWRAALSEYLGGRPG